MDQSVQFRVPGQVPPPEEADANGEEFARAT